MLPRFRTLLSVAAIAGVMALISPVAHAITITRAEVQWDDAVIMGRGAAANATISWQGFEVTWASKRGKFSFRSKVVPLDCEGLLSDTESTVPVELDNCTPESGEPPDPDPEPEPNPGPKMQIDAHGGEAVRAVGFVIDEGGRTWVISGGEDATLRSWDLENLEFQSFQLLDHPIYDLEVSADGSFAVTGEGDWNGGPGSDTLRIWDADDILLGTIPADQITGTTAPIGFVYCVAISPDNLWTVASGFYGDFVVYDTSSLDDPVVTKKTKIKRTKALAFSPDGNILASTSTAGRIQLWSFPKDKCDSFSCELERHAVSLSHGGSWVFPIAFAPYSIPGLTEIVSGSDGGMIKLWRFDLSAPPPDDPDFAVDSGAVYSLAYSPPDGSMIVAGGNGDITVYNADNLDILFHFVNAHDGRVNDVAFSPYGSFIVSGGADGALKLWDLGAQ